MVTRAFATLGLGDAVQRAAQDAVARLDALTVDGEPILSAYRAEQDGPWLLDILFTQSEAEQRARWLAIAREIMPELPPFEEDALAERDWVAESQRALHPVRAGRFTVFGSHDRARLPPSRWNICIDAERAFGTAHHATTQGCLIALERLACRRPLEIVADVGTGTGVLAIAATRLGAPHATASDIDPVAVHIAKGNIRANGAEGRVRAVLASGPVIEADTVVANILARPLVAMAPRLAASARSTLVLSGLRTADIRRVRAAYVARGFVSLSRLVIEDWATLTLVRHSRFRSRAGGGLAYPYRPYASGFEGE